MRLRVARKIIRTVFLRGKRRDRCRLRFRWTTWSRASRRIRRSMVARMTELRAAKRTFGL